MSKMCKEEGDVYLPPSPFGRPALALVIFDNSIYMLAFSRVHMRLRKRPRNSLISDSDLEELQTKKREQCG